MLMTRRSALASAVGLAAAGIAPLRAQKPISEPEVGPGVDIHVQRAVSLSDFESLARERMPTMAYEFVAGGAADEITLRANLEAFNRIKLEPRILVDVSRLDTRVTLFGQKLPFPILLAPTAYHRLVHPEGELATVRGANAAGAALVASSFATTSIEEMARETTRPLWFQLYVQPDRGFTRELVQRAEAAGCRVLCLTVDAPVLGARNREARAGFALPPGVERSNLRALGSAVANRAHRPAGPEIYSAVLDPTLTWKDVEWLRSLARVPVVLKGIMSPDCAAKAIESGISGLIVSNHGARNLDTLPATAEALPAVVEKVAGRVPVLVDGGIRRGTDVLKALALGASAVLIGRPYLYGLAANGEIGVSRIVGILRAEFEMAMALTGRTSLARIDRSVLWSRPC